MFMMKKIGVIVLVFFIVAAGIAYHYRHEIFQFSAEEIIKKSLPSYVTVRRIIFDLKSGIFRAEALGIKNPKGYYTKFLAEIDGISCRYKMKGKNILDGITVTEIAAESPVVHIERLPDGRININEMSQLMDPGSQDKAAGEKPAKKRKEGQERKPQARGGPAGKRMSDLIQLSDTINIKDGKIIFLDGYVSSRPYELTFEDINGDMEIKLSDDYKKVFSVASRGNGSVNGDRSQRIGWVVLLDPTTKDLRMSNRYEVANVDITLFKPYCEGYAPVIIDRGRVSGTLVFDFDKGNIGSMNTLRLEDFSFRVKKGKAGAEHWQTALPDIIKYLQSSPGEIIFDFKIKGNMNNPRFYPGPHVKEEIQNMVVDKISEALSDLSEPSADGQGGRTDVEKVVDIMKGIFK
ncbi:MAG: hypothetical protein DRP85_01815 [Candidatus Makaraimicrobium thalassicum]|nr:MAG: hypothetical protein DRP85_01815 [Candidatus Omnitrophota bacterium]